MHFLDTQAKKWLNNNKLFEITRQKQEEEEEEGEKSQKQQLKHFYAKQEKLDGNFIIKLTSLSNLILQKQLNWNSQKKSEN